MPRRRKLREDAAETAFRTLQEAIGERPKTLPPGERTEKNAEAQRRGAKGGKRGGRARAEKLTAAGAEVRTWTPEQFGAFIREEKARWAKVVKESGAKFD